MNDIKTLKHDSHIFSLVIQKQNREINFSHQDLSLFVFIIVLKRVVGRQLIIVIKNITLTTT